MHDLDRLVIVEDLRRLMASYVHLADHQRWEELAQLFTPDGTFTPRLVDGSPVRVMRGRREIADSIRRSVGPDATVVHHLFSDVIDVHSRDSADGTWAMEDLIIRPEGTADTPRTMHGFGHYRPRFVRAADGWRIAELELTRVRLEFT
ncbi:nuclear transport factor 2 family protein [Streptomyces sp. MS06]|uniref:nuclear transport factor 2 family protein n=1 Tax=Streptomyces sp. MS06 TaxID=3385974 RepID=UPI0039A1D95E